MLEEPGGSEEISKQARGKSVKEGCSDESQYQGVYCHRNAVRMSLKNYQGIFDGGKAQSPGHHIYHRIDGFIELRVVEYSQFYGVEFDDFFDKG